VSVPGDLGNRQRTVRVASVQPLDRSGLEVRVALDDGSSLELATEALERAGVGVGDPLDDEDRARLADADMHLRARDAALDLVARRPYSRQELQRRLGRKGFSRTVVESALDALAAQRLVDDGAFARSFVRDRLRIRPRGRRRLSQELREKGVDAGTIEGAVAEVFGEQGVREDALARDAALAWLRRQRPETRDALLRRDRSAERQRATRRLNGFLARRGFGGETARSALLAAVQAASAAAEVGDERGMDPSGA
jgi:regulatory protein